MAQQGRREYPSEMEVDALPQTTTADHDGKIPPLTNIVPSIFVPIDEDFTEPADLPRDRVDRLKWILKTIETQRKGVTENMVYLFEKERDRILAEAREKEATFGIPDTRTGLPPDEVDLMISNMAAPHQPDLDYNIRDMPPRSAKEPPPGLPPREEAAFKLLELVERALCQTEGYNQFMSQNRDFYLERLEKEKERIEGVGKRPEERSKKRP